MQHSSVLIICCILSILRVATADAPNVVTYHGTVIGSTDVTLRGRTFFSYRGIPYAQPPIGELRFKPPEQLDYSTKLIDARFDGKTCMQRSILFGTLTFIDGSEDCLFANIYTPRIASKLLPVMVYIHGGSFSTGTGASYLYGANYLLDKDVVLVTINYRLGALGFLSTGDSACPGNNGLKDQVAALKWIQQNIAGFGGDPNQVTLFGPSAGAASIHYHMLSDLSNDLFHNAICSSGGALNAWSRVSDPLPLVKQQAAVFNCSQENTTLLVDCLRGIDAKTLVNSSYVFYFSLSEPITAYRPVVEREWDGVSFDVPFLIGDPLALLQQGRFQKKPWLTGVVPQEGIFKTLPLLADRKELADLNRDWNTLGPQFFLLGDSIDNQAMIDDMWRNVTQYYFNDGLPLTVDNAINYINAYSDRFFLHGIHKAVQLQTGNGHDKIFLYNFNYKGQNSFARFFTTDMTFPDYGVGHMDDSLLILKANVLFADPPKTHPDRKVIDSLVTLWTNFATFGTPTPGSGSSSEVTCDPYSTTSDNTCDLSDLSWTNVPADQTKYLNIQLNNETNLLEFSIRDNFYQERMNFWDSSNLKENYLVTKS